MIESLGKKEFSGKDLAVDSIAFLALSNWTHSLDAKPGVHVWLSISKYATLLAKLTPVVAPVFSAPTMAVNLA